MKKHTWRIISIIVIAVVLIIGGCIMLFRKNNYITTDGDFARLFAKYYKIEEIDIKADMLTVRKGTFREEVEGYEKVLKDNDMEIVYNSNTMERIYIVVKNSDIKFGNKKVGIGDDKDKIKSVFRFSKHPKPPYAKFSYYDDSGKSVNTKVVVYCDNDYQISVGFEYDNKDKVKMIFIGYGPNN